MKRTRSDSAESAVKAMVNAAKGDLKPPAHTPLRSEAMKFWPGVVRARARDEWIDVDLVVAAQLAECQACIEEESTRVRSEGTVVSNDKGTLVANPRMGILEALARREMALMRTLRMGGRVAGDARDQSGKRKPRPTSRREKIPNGAYSNGVQMAANPVRARSPARPTPFESVNASLLISI